MIDIVDALDLLDECVRGEAAGHYSPEDAKLPGALLAAVVSQAFPSARGLLRAPLGPRSRAEDAATGRETISLGALIALRTADRKQRTGAPWVSSVAAARRAVMAYVDLLPERLLQEAADERPCAMASQFISDAVLSR